MDDFERFFADNYGPVVRALAVATRDSGAAEEVAQEAFARAVRRWGAVRAMERPATWVYVVGVREFGAQRKRRARAAARSDRVVGVPAGADATEVVDERVRFESALAALAPRQRMAIVLRYYADLSVAEVAEAKGCAVGTAKATLHGALARLRVQLDAADDA